MSIPRLLGLAATFFILALPSSLAGHVITRKDDSKNKSNAVPDPDMKIIGSKGPYVPFHYIPPRAPPQHVHLACPSLSKSFNTSLVDRLADNDPLYGMDGADWLS